MCHQLRFPAYRGLEDTDVILTNKTKPHRLYILKRIHTNNLHFLNFQAFQSSSGNYLIIRVGTKLASFCLHLFDLILYVG